MDYRDVFNLLCHLLLGLAVAHSEFPNRLSLSEAFYESRGSAYSDDLDEAGKFLKNFNVKADQLMNKDGLANWAYETDLTDKHLQETVDVGLELSEFFLASSENASQIKTLDLPPQMHRQISLIRRSSEPTSYAMRSEIKETIGKLTAIYSKGKVKLNRKNYTLSDLDELFKKSRKRTELNNAWKGWRDKVGPPSKSLYSNLVDLLNVGAREHGWIDYGDFQRSDYEMGDDFALSLDRVWDAIEPMYKELHAYVRYKLSKHYKIDKSGAIPANLFGNMYGQNWENIFELVKPDESSKTFDITSELKKQKYTVEKMFMLSQSFFISLGLDPMPESFWEKSVLLRPKDKDMVCHGSAWDVSRTDVRIKMCTKINQEDFTTTHHEMGHIEYFLAYQNQPNMFRAGANPGFHEAIGDTISLSVETPNYLKEVGLMDSDELKADDTISFLLNQALRRLAPIPYNLIVDKWRWRVYEGTFTENCYNKEWWNLRLKYQGVEPPVKRPSNAFDIASKYHIGGNVPYIAYFVSYVLQFQLHKSFCHEAAHKGPLHRCSIYKSKNAGKKLRQMLEAGRSKPWPIILKKATGERELKADAILEYFEPLHDWLREKRNLLNYPLGWKNVMSTQVLQKKTKKYEGGQERSGILKTNSGDVSLSINIPSTTLAEILRKSNATSAGISQDTSNNTQGKEPALDLNKLLGSAKGLSIKSSESSSADQQHPKTSTEEININSNTANSKTDEISSKTSENTKTNGKEHSGSDDFKPPNLEMLPLDSVLPSSNLHESANKSSDSTSNQQGLKPNTVSNSSALSDDNHHVPVPVNERPVADFPSTSVSQKEPKENPKTAGIAKEAKNPAAAAVPQEPKPNPVPSGSIALVPVTLPSNILSALKNALNVTQDSPTEKLEKSNFRVDSTTDKMVNSSQNSAAIASAVQNQNQIISDTSTNEGQKAFQNTTTEKQHDTNDTLAAILPLLQKIVEKDTTKTFNNSSQGANYPQGVSENSISTVPHNPQVDSQPLDASYDMQKVLTSALNANQQNFTSSTAPSQYGTLYNNEPAIPLSSQPLSAPSASFQNPVQQSPYSLQNPVQQLPYGSQQPAISTDQQMPNYYNGFHRTQKVSPCKRSEDSNCLIGKVTTEGDRYPVPSDNGLDASKQTVSISPSLLIQKLIEHHVAEKSTPDPVVNHTPSSGEANTNLTSAKVDNAQSNVVGLQNNTKIDFAKLVKALSGGEPNLASKNDTTEKANLEKIQNNGNNTSNSSNISYENFVKSLANLTNADTRGIKNNESFPSNCSGLSKRGGITLSFKCNDQSDKEQKKGGALSITRSELLQKLIDSKAMKNEVNKKTIPSARVVKTPTGFQLSFDLNPKDKIPYELTKTVKKKPVGRQQHVNVFNTAKGMIVKPKSSVQLLKPQFVPVQNQDKIELRNTEN